MKLRHKASELTEITYFLNRASSCYLHKGHGHTGLWEQTKSKRIFIQKHDDAFPVMQLVLLQPDSPESITTYMSSRRVSSLLFCDILHHCLHPTAALSTAVHRQFREGCLAALSLFACSSSSRLDYWSLLKLCRYNKTRKTELHVDFTSKRACDLQPHIKSEFILLHL